MLHPLSKVSGREKFQACLSDDEGLTFFSTNMYYRILYVRSVRYNGEPERDGLCPLRA